jgi:hypothetical protein
VRFYWRIDSLGIVLLITTACAQTIRQPPNILLILADAPGLQSVL